MARSRRLIGRLSAGLIALSLSAVTKAAFFPAEPPVHRLSSIKEQPSQAPLPSFEGQIVSVAVYRDHYQTIIDSTRGTCPDPVETAATTNQVLLEYTLLCEMLTEGMPGVTVELVPFPVENRVVQMLETGGVDIAGFGIGKDHAHGPAFLLSPPLMREGEFSKGLYTTAEQTSRMGVLEPHQLRHYRAVTNRNWPYDWQAMQCAGLAMQHIDRYEQMFQLVELGRADVLSLSFGSDTDMVKQEFGVALYPLQGLKITIPTSTHFVVSAASPRAEAILFAVERGMTALREAGELTRWYQTAGVLNPMVESWKSICPTDPDSLMSKQ